MLAAQVGEYLVCAELARRGLIATPFSGNVPEFASSLYGAMRAGAAVCPLNVTLTSEELVGGLLNVLTWPMMLLSGI